MGNSIYISFGEVGVGPSAFRNAPDTPDKGSQGPGVVLGQANLDPRAGRKSHGFISTRAIAITGILSRRVRAGPFSSVYYQKRSKSFSFGSRRSNRATFFCGS